MSQMSSLSISLYALLAALVISLILTFLKLNSSTRHLHEKIHKELNYGAIGLKAFKGLALYITPKWFELLQWLIILGFLNYIGIKTGNNSITNIYRVSLFLMIIYLDGVIENNPFFKISKLISFIYSLLFIFFLFSFLNWVVGTIVLLH